MPAGDQTGPIGLGPMTGRAAGYCAGFGAPGYMNPVAGRGFTRFGRRGWFAGGRGRGTRFLAAGVPGWAWFGATAPFAATPGSAAHWAAPTGDELTELNRQAEYFQNVLDEIKSRISQLEKGAAADT